MYEMHNLKIKNTTSLKVLNETYLEVSGQVMPNRN